MAMKAPLLGRISGRLQYTIAPLIPIRFIRSLLYYKFVRHPDFEYQGERLEYFFHSYNNWRTSERAIEIPIARRYLERFPDARVLEIGNVTNHYHDYFREAKGDFTVLDKFENAHGVIRMDVADYVPEEKYDLVLSISTFEHMDSDLGRNPDYVPGRAALGSVAADNIKHVADHMVKEGGTFLLTAPIGYTPEWDETFWSGALDRCGFSRYSTTIYAKESEITWKQIPASEARAAGSSERWPGVTCICVIEFTR